MTALDIFVAKKQEATTSFHTLIMLIFFGLTVSVNAFRYDGFSDPQAAQQVIQLLESGLATEKNVPRAVYYLSIGDYAAALSSVTNEDEQRFPLAAALFGRAD
jgi:hypothetical protein